MLTKKLIYKGIKKGHINNEKAIITCEIYQHTNNAVFRDWDTLQVVPDYLTVSITGEMKSECGQLSMSYGPDDVSTELKPIFKVWDYYHCNSLKAGTKSQHEVLGPDWSYDEACERLKSNGLYEDRNYKFGHEWLIHQLTLDEIEHLKSLFEQER